MAPTPHLILETARAYQRTMALRCAVELDIFTAIAEGIQTATELATCCRASERGIRILCDYLVISGFLEKENNIYSLTVDSAAFLDRRQPTYIGGAVEWSANNTVFMAAADLTNIVRQDSSTIQERDSAATNALWTKFAKNMVKMMVPAAEAIAQIVNAASGIPCKVLDIAAGHGIFGITIAKYNPQAEIFALDLPDVLAIAVENARNAGVLGRYRTIAGNAFEIDFGTDYDLVLITNFLHMFDIPTCEQLLAKAYRALKPGGKAVTLEYVPNPDRVTPPDAAAFSMNMLIGTAAGDAYTFAEYEEMFGKVGFKNLQIHDIVGSAERAIVSYK